MKYPSTLQEFKGLQPTEKFEDNEDIGDFIGFLDDKYKEWEESRKR